MLVPIVQRIMQTEATTSVLRPHIICMVPGNVVLRLNSEQYANKKRDPTINDVRIYRIQNPVSLTRAVYTGDRKSFVSLVILKDQQQKQISHLSLSSTLCSVDAMIQVHSNFVSLRCTATQGCHKYWLALQYRCLIILGEILCQFDFFVSFILPIFPVRVRGVCSMVNRETVRGQEDFLLSPPLTYLGFEPTTHCT